ncbi:HNH endonuclease signature motif containing protein [Streptomyces paludis]|uniref:HNH endonuclease n=1 Tax=Streptomyces paludis TaxID=2282738 RepID=A0A345HMY4_9ACTN|nr:HNH endonuclease signature motif containing protein [Streptomyces paludis]AXG78058.1 HNH endonuclease [Streptomyces paludis]
MSTAGRRNSYPRELLERTAAEATSLVDLLRRLGTPLGSSPFRYVRSRLEVYGIDTSHFREEPLPPRDRRSYTRERLAEAAAKSNSIREILEFMGFPPCDSPYGHIRKKLDQFGIDTSHFTRRYGSGGGILPLSELAPAVAASTSLAGVIRLLGLRDGGAARARVKRSIAAHGLSSAHFTGQGHTQGLPSPHRKSAADLLLRLAPGSPRTKTVMLRRALDELETPRVCAECGIGDMWQGKRLVLEIDHVNGDRLDNRAGNLRYLCPSCHSQTNTFAKAIREAQ